MKRMIKIFATVALLLGMPALADLVKAPAIPDGEVRIYNAYYSDESYKPEDDDPIMKAIGDFTPVWYSGEARWDGEGDDRRLVYTRESDLRNGAKTVATFVFETSPSFRLLSYTNLTHAPGGEKIAEEFYNFTNPALRYPDDTFHVVVGNMVVRASDLYVGKEIKFTVWLTSTMVYTFGYEVVGEETITTEAGTFDCYKIEGGLMSEGPMDLTGVIINLATGKYYFWVEKDGSHGFVRLHWPISSGVVPGRTRYQVQDLVEIRREGAGQ